MLGSILGKRHHEHPVKMKLTVLLEREDDGSYYAFSPALKGLHVGGETEAEALQNVRDAIIVYMNSLMRHGDPLPVGEFFSVEDVPRSSGAVKKDVTFECPSLQMCGAS